MTYTFSSKKFQKFQCIECDYITSRKSQWNRHVETQKHKRLTKYFCDNIIIGNVNDGKTYKQRQSLYNHKKSCKIIKNDTINKMDK